MSDQSRRKFLKSVAAGGGAVIAGRALPESWTRPVVEAVILPAHAALSSSPPPVEPVVYDFDCMDASFIITNPVPGTLHVAFGWLPTESSGLLTGTIVGTHYVCTDSSGVRAQSDINNTEFNQNPAGVSFDVVAPLDFIHVVITYQDQVTYGTASCVHHYVIPG